MTKTKAQNKVSEEHRYTNSEQGTTEFNPRGLPGDNSS